MVRKTLDITYMIEMVNYRNRGSTCSPDVREGWNSLLEQMLIAADVYAGFGYLVQEDVPEGQLAGMIPDRYGRGQHEFPDESRKYYITHPKLKFGRKISK